MENEQTNFSYKQVSPYFSDSEAGFGVLLFIVLQFLVIRVARILIASGLTYSTLFGEIISFLIEIVFVGSVLIISKVGKKNFIKATGLNKKVNGKLVLTCFFICIFCLFGLSQVSNFFAQILEYFGYHSTSSGINVTTIWELLLNTFLVAIVPAVCEEIMFRGLVLNGLARFGKHFAVIMSALLFMLMHGSPDQTVHQFILGVVFGYIVYYTGNLWLTIIIHFFNNFIVLLINFIANLTGKGGTDAVVDSSQTPIIAQIISIIISFAIVALAVYLIIYAIRRIFKDNHQLNGSPDYITSDELSKAKIEVMAIEENYDDGAVVYKVNPEKPKDKIIGNKALIYLIISSVYLGVEWILALVNGFVS